MLKDFVNYVLYKYTDVILLMGFLLALAAILVFGLSGHVHSTPCSGLCMN